MDLTDRQKLYLYHAFILRKAKKQILADTDLTEEEFKTWWTELELERNRIKPIRDLWINKKCEAAMGYYDFEKQYLELKNACHYCGITEAELEQLWKIEEANGKSLTKRGRGKKLELDRIDPNAEYAITNNLVLACYWCNNAKTDTFTGDEFKEVGKVFRQIWDKRLGK